MRRIPDPDGVVHNHEEDFAVELEMSHERLGQDHAILAIDVQLLDGRAQLHRQGFALDRGQTWILADGGLAPA